MRRRGFTLVELLVALTVAGIVLLLGHRFLLVAGTTARHLASSRQELDETANARRWLAAAFLSLEAGGQGGSFDGRPDRMEFGTWLEEPEGWFSAARVTISLRGANLTAEVSGRGAVVLADSTVGLALDYLLEPGVETRWATTWISPVSAPLAVRLRVARQRVSATQVDTMLFLIRERG